MLHQSDAEILFPTRVISHLRALRGPAWCALVDYVDLQGEESLEKQAFTLMMIRLDGCLTCHANSHRAMLGCTACAVQRIARFKGSDAELLAAYEQARSDIGRWHSNGTVPLSEQLPPAIQFRK